MANRCPLPHVPAEQMHVAHPLFLAPTPIILLSIAAKCGFQKTALVVPPNIPAMHAIRFKYTPPLSLPHESMGKMRLTTGGVSWICRAKDTVTYWMKHFGYRKNNTICS